MDFSFVTPRLATGAALSGETDALELRAAGITHVLDVTDGGDDTPFFAAVPGVLILWNPTADDGQPKPNGWFAGSLMFALFALALPRTKVYAHCSAGINRGPSTAYAVMRAQGWTAEQAEAQIRAARPQVGLAYKADADRAVSELGYA